MNAKLQFLKSARTTIVLGLILSVVFSMNPVSAFADVVRKNYIVSVVPDTQAQVRESIAKLGETPHDELFESMDGFFISMTDLEADALRLDPNVLQIVEDQPMQLLDVQSPTPSWGLDRIDQTSAVYDGAYNYPAGAGEGVRAYVVDTGVMASNPDFAGRMLPGFDALGQGLESADCHGHGTHVAGTIAGTKYGVAKKASIVPIRVLGCTGSGSWSGFISGVDWIIKNNPAGQPAVMSASIGGSFSALVNAAIERLYQAGITPVIAAGNSNADACGYSPAAAANAITVGASDSVDARASFSNYGDCVDVFAPGVKIVSDSHTDLSGSAVMSGTSMATPHVSGLAALYLAANPTATPAQVTSEIRAGAISGIVTNALSNNGNFLINNNFVKASLPVPVPSPDTPTNLAVGSITTTGAVVTWSAAATGAAATSYVVEYKVAGSASWSAMNVLETTANLTGLFVNTSYSIRVSALNESVTSVPSAELMFSTGPDVPGAVRNFRKIYDYGNKVLFAWDAPASLGGATSVTYKSEEFVNGSWVLRTASTPSANILQYTTPQTTYSWRITALNVSGAGVATEYTYTSNSLAPANITGLTVGAIAANTAVVKWNAVPQVGVNAIQYSVKIYTGTYYSYWQTQTVGATSLTLSGLNRKTNYAITVTAFSDAVAGPTSASLKFVTTAKAATAPTSTKVTVSGTTATLAWMSPSDSGGENITGYVVQKLGTGGVWSTVSTLLATEYSITVPKPARATTDSYRVAAVNSVGTGDWAAINVVTAADKPSAVQNFVAVPVGNGQLMLTWSAPSDNGGAAVTSYQVQRSLNNGALWSTVVSTASLAAVVSAAPKGTSVLYSVVALNSSGAGTRSDVFTSSTAATAPSAIYNVRTSWAADGSLVVAWNLPTDIGGSPLTAIRVEQSINNNGFVALPDLAGTVGSITLPRALPGTVTAFRVTALNAVGASPLSNTATTMVPYLKPGTPSNLTAVAEASTVSLRWDAPLELGGSAIKGYQLQISANNGVSWSTRSLGVATSYAAPKPAKGLTYIYRVAVVTGYGVGDYSTTVSISTATTVASAVPALRASLNATGQILINWSAPYDNGGSPVTSYRVEKSYGAEWATAASVTTAAVVLSRELPGVRVAYRVVAINAIGESLPSAVYAISMPFVAATAPENFVVNLANAAINLSWTAPTYLGGSTVSRYLVQSSSNNGATWINTAYIAGSATGIALAAPGKGLSVSYRVAAVTAFGTGAFTGAVSVSRATTVASEPTSLRASFASDGSVSVIWNAPRDNGGSPILNYALEKNLGAGWVTAASTSMLTLQLPRELPGVRVSYRVVAVNAVGASLPSAVVLMQMPFIAAAAPTNLVASQSAKVAVLNWTAPTELGGSTISRYLVQMSANSGATWTSIAYSNGAATSVNATLPAKGSTAQYRVAAVTAFGIGVFSSSTTLTAAQTVTSGILLSSLVRTATGLALTFRQPSDLGGYGSFDYRLQQLVNGGWVTIASGVGSSVQTVAFALPVKNVTSYYRVVAVNASGESSPVGFSYRW